MTTSTWVGGDNNAWGGTPGGADNDWSPAFTPDQTNDVVIDNTAPGDVTLQNGGEFKTLNTTGFTGSLLGTGEQHAYGNVTIGAGTINPDVSRDWTFHVNATLLTNGVTMQGVGAQDGATLTLGDNYNGYSSRFLAATGAGSTLAMGTKTATFHVDTDGVGGNGGGLRIDPGNFLTWSTGAKIIGISTGLSYLEIDAPASLTLPPIELSGDGDGYLYLDSNSIKAQSISVIGGGIYFDIGGYETVGDFTITDALLTLDEETSDMDGQTVTVGGNLSVTNTDLTNGIFNVTGLADHLGGANKTITDCDFSGGSTLYAPGCTDGGGNTNVVFGARPEEGGSDSASNSTSVGAGAGF